MSDKKNKINIPEMKNKIVIVAPHCDDEIIGCYEIIQNNPDNPPVILYVGNPIQERRDEAIKLREHTGVTMQLFPNSIPPIFMNPSTVFYFPDPIYETHPLHRLWGSQGENMLRGGLNVTFYTTNMNSPYVHETKEPEKKEELLNKMYPSQKLLWEYDKKYVLFEGRYKWIM